MCPPDVHAYALTSRSPVRPRDVYMCQWNEIIESGEWLAAITWTTTDLLSIWSLETKMNEFWIKIKEKNHSQKSIWIMSSAKYHLIYINNLLTWRAGWLQVLAVPHAYCLYTGIPVTPSGNRQTHVRRREKKTLYTLSLFKEHFVCGFRFIPRHSTSLHDDVIKWKHFPRYWPPVKGIHRWPVNSHHKGQWRGTLMFSLTCAWTNN